MLAACDRAHAPPPADPAMPPGDPATENGLYEIPGCATSEATGSGSGLVFPRRTLPALVLPGAPLVLRVRQARSILAAPGVQRGRALWGWDVRLEARDVLALGVAPGDAAARRPALRYALRVTDVRAEDSHSLVYRVRVELPRAAVPATYDLTVRRPGVALREPSAVRVLVPGRAEHVVRGGRVGDPELVDRLHAWGRAGADLVVLASDGTSSDDLVGRLPELAGAPVPLLLLPPADRPAPRGWARLVGPSGFAYALGASVYPIGRCPDGRDGPVREAAQAGQSERREWRARLRALGELGREGGARGDDSALRSGPPGSLLDATASGGTPPRAAMLPARRDGAIIATGSEGTSEARISAADAPITVVALVRRGERLACEPAVCRLLALGPSPDPFTAPLDASVALVLEVARGARATLSAQPAGRRTLEVRPDRATVDAGQPFALRARAEGFRARRVLWALEAPPSADWALDEQPSSEGALLRHRIRAPGTHRLRALAIADDGSLATAGATVEVVAAAGPGCAAAGAGRSSAGRAGPTSAGTIVLLAIGLASCFIRARRNGQVDLLVEPPHDRDRTARRLPRGCPARGAPLGRLQHVDDPQHRRGGHGREP